MAVIGLLALVLAAAIFVLDIIFIVQITGAAITLISPETDGFMDKSNPFAWILIFLALFIAALIFRFLSSWINILAAIALGALGNLLSHLLPQKLRGDGNIYGAITVASLLIWAFWAFASIWITAGVLGWFAERPELSEWLAEGGFFPAVITYLFVMSLVFPTSDSD